MKKIVGYFILMILVSFAQSFSYRDLPSQYTPGTSFNVYLFIYLENSPPGVVVSETLPFGWTIDRNSPVPYHKYKPETNTYKWIYYDNSGGIELIEIIYKVNVPNDAYGTKQFSGNVVTTYETIITEGDTTISSSITRIIRLEGNLNFGQVIIGNSSTKKLRIYNDGNSILSISNIIFPEGFSSNWSSGEIQPSNYQEIDINFTPNQEKVYSGDIEVISNKTDGNNTISVYGEGISIPSVIQNLKFYDINGNLLNENFLPVDEIVKVKGEFVSGEENNQKESQWQIIENERIIFEKFITSGELSECYIPRNLLSPDKNYILKVRTKNLEDSITGWFHINFGTIQQYMAEDSDGNGVPENQEPQDTSNWKENLRSIFLNNYLIQIESPANTNISYFCGHNVFENPPYGNSVLGFYTIKIEVPIGEEIELRFTFPEVLPPKTRWYKYDELNYQNKWILYEDFEIQENVVLVTVKDGGKGDMDGVENGIIFDPLGPVFILGDLNYDEVIDITDVILCLRMAIGLNSPNYLIGDFNRDKSIDISDVILILRKAIGL